MEENPDVATKAVSRRGRARIKQLNRSLRMWRPKQRAMATASLVTPLLGGDHQISFSELEQMEARTMQRLREAAERQRRCASAPVGTC